MINCMIVDDEPLAREVIEKYINDLPNLKLEVSCRDALDAIDKLNVHDIDLLFLDINMPKLSGINFYKSLSKKPNVIFTTAYPDYAVEGFELEAVDYLLKPFSFERFVKAVNKVQVAEEANKSVDFIMLKEGKKSHKVNYHQIRYFESIGDYVKVYLEESKALIINDTLRKLEKTLPQNFMRIHKTYIISINKLKYLEGNLANIGDTKIPIGQSYRDKVNSIFRK